MTKVTLYTRAGCCLCDDAKAALLDLRREFDFDFEEVDIEGDPELFERYVRCIPVLHLNGRGMFRGKVNLKLLRLRLRMIRMKPNSHA